MISDEEKIKLLVRLADGRTSAAALKKCLQAARPHRRRLASLADENHVLPAIAKNIVKNGLLDAVPAGARDMIARLPTETAARNMLLEAAAREIISAAAEKNIAVLPLKGITFIGRIYGHDERPLSDIDFLFRRDQLPGLETLMAGLGYSIAESRLPAGFARELSGELEFTAARSGAAVGAEFHWDPAPAPALKKAFSFGARTLWRLCRVQDGRYTLSAEGEILYHIFHLAVRHSFSRLMWLLDLHRLIASQPPDWDKLSGLLRDARLGAAARYTFRFMERFLGTEFPVAVQQQFHGGRAEPDPVDKLIVSALAGNKAVKKSGIIPILVSERKAAFLFNNIFPPPDFLRRRYPGVPAPLLYVYRPLDFAAKMLGAFRK